MARDMGELMATDDIACSKDALVAREQPAVDVDPAVTYLDADPIEAKLLDICLASCRDQKVRALHPTGSVPSYGRRQ